MKKLTTRLAAILITAFVLGLFVYSDRPLNKAATRTFSPPALPANATVYFQGLNNPRGLEFGSDGSLYVAEGGLGGQNSTAGLCEQVKFPVGPYTGSTTGSRVSQIDQNKNRSTVVDNLPSSQTGPALGGLVSGASDVAFIDNTLYVLLAGAGCSHGVPSIPNGIVRANSDGTWDLVANLSAFQQSHPVANPEEGDFEPDGTEYSMVAVRGDLYVVEPNHGEILRFSPKTGEISRVVDVSATQGHIVPTTIAYKGNFFFGNLGTFPIDPGTQRIMKLTPSGNLETWATGLSTVLGIAIDHRDRMYVLESMTEPGLPGPQELGSGKVVRIEPDGTQTVIADGLSFPGAMTLGPDGALYVSNISFGAPPIGLGQIVRIEIPN